MTSNNNMYQCSIPNINNTIRPINYSFLSFTKEMLVEKVNRLEEQETMKSHHQRLIVDANQSRAMPTSCQDLSQMGHVLSGLYSVMGIGMVQSVYCDFTQLPNDPSEFFSSLNEIEKSKNGRPSFSIELCQVTRR